ncbi:glycosyltransferase family 61 protein [Laspinema palackyanum]|uniref:glycosyltransferase family 61 protein n=1 Tax=Laspinema palackyanum TaxID=3231601 RepID=UPI00345C7120|nr:glycosyltransferase family 61 protein [Laspinema sp. D2c]
MKSYIKSFLQKIQKSYTPQGFYPTIGDWWNQLSDRQRKSNGLIQNIYPPQTLCRQAPKTIDAELYWKFTLDYGTLSRPAYLASVEGGRFCQGVAVITPDNYLLSDASIYMRIDPNKPEKHPIFHQEIPSPTYLDKTVAVLSSAGANTFFHWIVDVLPRYALLRRSPDWFEDIDYFIVNDLAHAFQRDSLNLLNIPQEKIITAADYPHLQAKRLLVPSFVRHQTCNIGNWVFDFLRQELVPQSILDSDDSQKTRRLYISRNKASSRRLLNEEVIFDRLQPKGFEKVFLEDYSLSEQIELFATANCVVAPHGAGLTNLIFCPKNTKVLEIYSPNYVSVSYWNISNQVGLDYYYLFGSGERPKPFEDPHLRLEDIQVNIPEFEAMLKQMQLE